jgi:hypothetical protein
MAEKYQAQLIEGNIEIRESNEISQLNNPKILSHKSLKLIQQAFYKPKLTSEQNGAKFKQKSREIP